MTYSVIPLLLSLVFVVVVVGGELLCIVEAIRMSFVVFGFIVPVVDICGKIDSRWSIRMLVHVSRVFIVVGSFKEHTSVSFVSVDLPGVAMLNLLTLVYVFVVTPVSVDLPGVGI